MENTKMITGILILLILTVILRFSMIPDEREFVQVEEMHEVQSGETLWSIACEYQDKSDIKEYILAVMYKMEQINPEMHHGQVYEGDKIKAYYWQRK